MTNRSKILFQKHEQLLNEVRVYTKQTLTPVAQEYDESGKFPTEFMPFFFEKDVFHLLNSDSSLDLGAFFEMIRIVSRQSLLLWPVFY